MHFSRFFAGVSSLNRHSDLRQERSFLRLALVAILLFTGSLTARSQQNASIIGRISDAGGLVVANAQVTATEITSGAQVTATSSDRGEYHFLNLPSGQYNLQVTQQGFRKTQQQIQLLVGQNATVDVTLAVGSTDEVVNVEAATPAIDTESAQVVGNVDRRQMQELPLQGRNWMELSLQVKGITSNSVDQKPGIERDDQFQLNLDGQQVTQKNASSSFGQPKFSREAIAEFQIITNMFDVTQGRSSVSQVSAVSKSGTNQLHGSAYGYFRNDALNAADPVARRVLPYSNQQVGGSLGGPIRTNKLFYFGNYEFEREPNTTFIQPNLLTTQNFSFANTVKQHNYFGRIDQQLTERDRLSYRFTFWKVRRPFDVSTTSHPTQAGDRTRNTLNFLASWTHISNQNTVHEVKIGYNHFEWRNNIVAENLNSVPIYRFTSVSIGAARDWPSAFQQNMITGRYDLTKVKGTHQFKVGGEWLQWRDTGEWHLLERGEFVFASNPPDLAARFPQATWNDPTTWNLSGLDSRVLRFDQNFGNFNIDIPRPSWAVWIGDTWKVHPRLTINYGIRWDDDWGATATGDVSTLQYAPFNGPLFKKSVRDHNNVAPRVGVNWRPTSKDDFVLRGGFGIFYGTIVSNITYGQQQSQRLVTASFPNDGKPGFLQDPRRGITPQQILSGAVTPVLAPRVVAHNYVMPYTMQATVGGSKQFGKGFAFDSDLLFYRSLKNPYGRDINLYYDPATGYNKNPSTAGRPDARYGQIQWMESTGVADYLAIASGLSRRFRNHVQGGFTHTLMFYKRDNSNSFNIEANNPFNPKDEFSRSVDFQRNTIRTYVLYQAPWGFSFSGIYGFGSGSYYATSLAQTPYGKPGTNRLNLAAPINVSSSIAGRFNGPSVIATGAVVPRNALRGINIHKVDLRVTKSFRLADRYRVSIQAEMFNLLNHANYGSYNSVVGTSDFGAPRQNQQTGYSPRTGQMAVRLDF